ncbi:MAG: hypothetical protein HZA31_10225 [Opitutae bacterium]|nr:hypothetical protein [Opitutae bacterium]
MIKIICLVISGLLLTQVSFAQKAVSEEHKNTSSASDGKASMLKHKPLAFLKAKVHDGKVQVRFVRKVSFYKKELSDLFSEFRIYRKKVDFALREDSTEFCDGLSFSDAEMIYKGPIKPHDKTTGVFIYTDDNVAVGQTYAYWAAAAYGDPIGPCPVKIRDPLTWWSADKISKEVYDLQKSYPESIKISILGKTIKGRDILGIEAGRSGRKVALVGAVHASESGPELIIPVIRAILDNHKSVLNDISIVAIPCVNLDRRQMTAEGVPWYLRSNYALVDLNRNFPADWEIPDYSYGGSTADPDFGTYRGPAPASEPETQAVASFVKQHRPSMLLSFHALGGIAGRLFLAPPIPPGNEIYKKKYIKFFEAYSQSYCAAFSGDDYAAGDLEKYLLFKSKPGTLPTWCQKEFGIPACDVELHLHKEQEKALTDEVSIELLTRNQQQHTAALLNLLKMMREDKSF